MNFSAPFIRRPVATTLLTLGVALAGIVAFFLLPVSPLPQVDFPTISVQAQLPGASPRDDGDQRRDAARAPSRPDRRRHRDDLVELGRLDAHHAAVRPRPRHRRRRARRAGGDQRRARRSADQPAQQSDLPQGQPRRRADPDPGADLRHPDAGARSTTPPTTVLQQKLSQVDGHRPGRRSAAARCRRCASSSTRTRCSNTASASRTCAPRSPRPTPTAPRARSRDGDRHYQIYTNDQARKAPTIPPLDRRLSQRRGGAAVRRRRRSTIRSRTCATRASPTASPRCWSSSTAQPGANIIDTVDRVEGAAAAARGLDPERHRRHRRDRPHDDDPRLAARRRAHAADRRSCWSSWWCSCSCAIARADADPERRRAGLADRHLRRRCTCSATASTICR